MNCCCVLFSLDGHSKHITWPSPRISSLILTVAIRYKQKTMILWTEKKNQNRRDWLFICWYQSSSSSRLLFTFKMYYLSFLFKIFFCHMGCSQASMALDPVWLQSLSSGLLLLTWRKNKVWPLLFELLHFLVMISQNILHLSCDGLPLLCYSI